MECHIEYILDTGISRILRVDMENFNPEIFVFMEAGHTVMGNVLPVAKLFLIKYFNTCVKYDKWILCNLVSFDKI
jgi:hypothetical protein